MSERQRRFAEDTKVPADETRNQIETLLKRNKATRFFYADMGHEVVIGFWLNDRVIRMTLPMPDDADKQAQEVRRRWRALLLILKAKLEAIASGVSTFEQEFMANIVMPDGQTVSAWARPQIADAYDTGHTPPLLLPPPRH